ncbi:inositol monophosphatase family protein [Natronobacterium gregoryi]|uniref:fructose-bisphosphatase n=2 Tax=Natronobacterium gregoryi TaxID=44930 RepID=L0ADF7_NATGS|nr:inositol monophosphatase [Natronobacterium gregoryi]AFZ71464.1 inositol monophosphatase/fructose-1,6-bisphosphatase family protein [Natronobacterium gregoryi SP2]ELY66766.1 inositol monophosphatase [Natronobacterium gregoryi SP2]PLK19942.1 inositol monophosphatase [Natronobacterium gregoryi SP2]SFJ36359.1 myo-inositol-1(or 4)-monophosphatase [Natronobacterium gregoryi]
MSHSSDRTKHRRTSVAVSAAEAGAEVATDSFRGDLEVDSKDGETDLVTQADRDAQTAVIEEIRAAFPDDPIVGEEDEELKAVPDEGPAWIVDPIDGTNNYVAGIRGFGTAVAAVVDGEPVAGANVFPALSDTYRVGPDGVFRNGEPLSVSGHTDPELATVCPTFWWDFHQRDQYANATSALVERFADIRRFGCAQLELALVAAGALEGAVTNLQANPWDTVAGVALVRAAGGTVTDLEGDRWRHDSQGLVASNGGIHDELLEAAGEIDGD